MRNSLLITLALVATYANAEIQFGEQDYYQEEEEYQEDDQLDHTEGRMLKKKQCCEDRVKSPDDMYKECYFRTGFYKNQKAADKAEQLWKYIARKEDPEAEPQAVMWDKFDNFFTQKGSGSFCQAHIDANRQGRPKTIHTQGLVARVSWVPVEGNGYSGFLETGSDNIIMRISEAQNLTELSQGLTPAAAFKFLVDGTESQNILVQNSFLESDSWNFFENRLANRVEPLNEKDHPIEWQTLHRKLTESNITPYGLAISHIADKFESGEKIPHKGVSVPWELQFKAPADKKANFHFDDNSENWYDRLRDLLSEGDTIYEVYGCTAPGDENCETKIADVVLQTDLVAGEKADEKIFFMHKPMLIDRQYYNKDKTLRKAFDKQKMKRISNKNMKVPKNVWPEDIAEAEEFYIDQVAESGCPFAWLLQ